MPRNLGRRARRLRLLRDLLIVSMVAGASVVLGAFFDAFDRVDALHLGQVEGTAALVGLVTIGVTLLTLLQRREARNLLVEHQRLESALAESEEKYRSLVETIPAAVYTEPADDSVATLYMSPQIQAITGCPAEKWVDEPDTWPSLIHPADRERVLGEDRRTKLSEEPFNMEFRLVKPDGSIVWVHDEAVLLRDREGRPHLWQGFMADITREKLAEEKLREAEERYRTLVEQIPAATFIHEAPQDDPTDLAPVYVSPQIETLIGYSPQEWLDDMDLWDKLVHPDDHEAANAKAQAAFQAGTSLSQEYRMIARDGRTVWVREEAVMVRKAQGEPWFLHGVYFDITASREAEERLRQAEERYRTLVEELPAIVYTDVIDSEDASNWPTVYISPQIERVLGYTPEEWLGDPDLWARIVHPDDLEAALFEDVRELEVQRGAQAAPAPGPAAIGDGTKDYRIYAKDGRLVWLRDHATVARDQQGVPRFQRGILTDVTDVKLAEELARAAEDRYRSLLQNLPVGFYVEPVDPSLGGTGYASPQMQLITGYPPETWLVEPAVRCGIVHIDDRDRVLAAERRAVEAGERYQEDYRIVKPDGSIVWVHDEAVLVRNDEGAPLRWEGFLQDVTARKDAEGRHREAEVRYRTLVEGLPAIVYMDPNDLSDPTIYVSPQVESILGYPPESFTSDPEAWYELIHPDDVERQIELDKASIDTGRGFREEYRFIARDGHVVWVDDRTQPVRNERGEIVFWHGVMLDITERKRAEERAREAEAGYQALVEGIPGVVYVDSNDPISSTSYLSPQIQNMTGYPPEEFVGEPRLWEKIVHPEDVEHLWRAEIAADQRRSPYVDEYRLLARDGSVVWVSDHAFPIFDSSGSITRWLGVMTDVTKMKEAEAEVTRALELEREATARLRELDDMKDLFLTGVSHELRTPLTSVLGSAVTLDGLDGSLDHEERRGLVSGLLRSAKKLDRLLQDLLDVDRLSRGVLQPQRRPVDLRELADRVIEGSELRSSRQIVLEADAVTASVDVAMVERILENLLVNAAKHTPADAHIWIRTLRQREGVLLAVEDDGPGIAEEVRGQIFEPFRRGPSYLEHTPGIGVGLSLVAQFAGLHGGRAWVEDREGGGASFKVFLPDDGSVGTDRSLGDLVKRH